MSLEIADQRRDEARSQDPCTRLQQLADDETCLFRRGAAVGSRPVSARTVLAFHVIDADVGDGLPRACANDITSIVAEVNVAAAAGAVT